MALGGGTFVTQNKTLPGTYINFVSAGKASAELSDRGVAAMPLILDWGVDDEVFALSAEEFQKASMAIFGYAYDHDNLKGLRDLFENIQTGYFYKLMNAGVKASNTFCDARYKGIRGNDITIAVSNNADDSSRVDVATYLDTTLVDQQTVLPDTDNLEDNSYVIWKSGVVLTETAGLALADGSNGTAVTAAEYQAALDAFESYSFNAFGCVSATDTIVDLVTAWTKRLRDEVGMKFQTVVYRASSADYEGIISVENQVSDAGISPSSMVYWVTGAQAGCGINRSLTNKVYNGAFTVEVSYTQSELSAALEGGKFIFHKVGDSVRVLEDINTYVTVTDTKNSDFSSNQTVRVIDQMANDMAALYNTKYLGQVQNNADGRISLWSDVVSLHKEMESIGAIESFDVEDVSVEQGSSKKAVVISNSMTPVNAMTQLYMTTIVE